jgi:septum formation protein
MIKNKQQLYLASQSPRRQQLLRAADIDFKLLIVDVAEDYPSEMAIYQVPEYLAEKKAHAALEKADDGIILSADCIVIVDGRILEKPQNRDSAKHMLNLLSGRTHEVITGVCLKSITKTVLFSDCSKVTMEKLSEAEIHYYVDTYKPYDKAGSYAIQEWIGYCKIKRIEGSYPNIMGLPTHLVYAHLQLF